MQDNHAQWHVERTTTKKVNSVTREENEELTAKLDELVSAVKGKETQVKAISENNVEEVDFIARNDYNPAWKKNYSQGYQKPYPNFVGAPNNFSGTSNGSLQESLKSFMHSQTEQNNILVNIMENHDNMLGKLLNQYVSLRNDVQALQERTRIVEAQLGKITESQTLILAKFAGKAEPNLIEDLKMIKVQREEPKELDYSNAPSPTYTVEDLVKRISLKTT